MPKTNDTTYQINQPVVFFPGALCDERIFNLCWQYLDIPMRAFVPLQWAEDLAQMKMLMTRLGENSRMVITGDLEQYDRIQEVNGLEDFLDKFKGKRSSSITSVEFQKGDIQREEVVKEVLDIYGGDIPACYQYEETGETDERDSTA